MAATEWVIVRLRMQDANKFIADARASGAAVRTMGREADSSAGYFDKLTHRSFWLQQALFTTRRVVYGLTLGLVALGGAAVAMGFQFNSTIEQQQLAFVRFTGSAHAATAEINYLFNLAARTPFEFQQVIQADRQLMAFGFTAKQTRPIIESLSDAMAGMGLDQSGLDRATLALGQIRATGRLMGQDLRQLEQLGLVSPEDLAKRLNVPLSGILQPGNLNIPSEKAIDAIVAYWQDRFHGAADEFQRTWVGRISTLRDIGAQTFGAMTKPLQKNLEDNVLPAITRVAMAGQVGFKKGGMQGFFEALDKSIGKGTNLARTWNNMAEAGTALFTIVETLALSFLAAWNFLQPGMFILPPIIIALRAMAWIVQHMQGPLAVLIGLWILEKSVLTALAIIKARTVILDIAIFFWTNMVRRAETLYILWLYRGAVARRAAMLASVLLSAATLFLSSVTWGAVASFIALTVAFFASPIGWVTLAVIGLVAAFVILWKKWDDFRHMVQWVWDKLKQFYNWLDGHKIGDLLHLPKSFGSFGFHNPLHALGFASGGVTPYTGTFMTGERGPELVQLPRGTSITPMTGGEPIGISGSLIQRGTRELLVRIPLIVDGRELAEATARYSLDDGARA